MKLALVTLGKCFSCFPYPVPFPYPSLIFHNHIENCAEVHAAGIPKRPVIPLQEETLHCVDQYLEHLPNRDKFDQPLVIPARDALVGNNDIPDFSPMHRVNAAAGLRHRLRQSE